MEISLETQHVQLLHVQSICTYHTFTIHTIYHTDESKDHQRLQESILLYMRVCLCAYKANVCVSPECEPRERFLFVCRLSCNPCFVSTALIVLST